MRMVKRSAVTILGIALLGVGVALMVLPGPGILLIVAGLAVLATEYVWAQRLLSKAREQAVHVQQQAVASPLRTYASVAFALGMVALGIVMLVIEDVSWPVAGDLIGKVWGPVTGSILIVTGAILLVTTYLTIRAAGGKASTYMEHDEDRTSGSTRYR